MEYLMAIGVIIVFVLILGRSFLPLMILILGLMELFAILCVLFFMVSAVLVMIAKRKNAVFLDVDKDNHGIGFAFYEVDGEECRNLFPTDAFLRKILYRRKEVKVRVLRIRNNAWVFDAVTLWIIGIGLPVFGLIALMLHGMIRVLW